MGSTSSGIRFRAKARIRSLIRAFAMSAVAALADAHADAPAPSAPLTGPAAWSRIVGNTVAGSTPDGPYTESFAADGSLRILDRDGRAGGRWALRDGALCTTVDDEDEECRSIEVDGAAGAFVDPAGTRYPFTILPGDAKVP